MVGMDLVPVIYIYTEPTPTAFWQPKRGNDLDMSQRAISDRVLALLLQARSA